GCYAEDVAPYGAWEFFFSSLQRCRAYGALNSRFSRCLETVILSELRWGGGPGGRQTAPPYRVGKTRTPRCSLEHLGVSVVCCTTWISLTDRSSGRRRCWSG